MEGEEDAEQEVDDDVELVGEAGTAAAARRKNAPPAAAEGATPS